MNRFDESEDETPGDDSLREWLAAEPECIAMADGLKAPKLPAKGRVIPIGRWAMQAAAAGAIFVGGYWAGHSESGPTDQAGPAEAIALPRVASESAVIQAVPIATPAPVKPSPQRGTLLRPGGEIKSVQERDGRLIYETVLADSGIHAVWVVDGGAQLAQASTLNQGEIR